MVNLMLN